MSTKKYCSIFRYSDKNSEHLRIDCIMLSLYTESKYNLINCRTFNGLSLVYYIRCWKSLQGIQPTSVSVLKLQSGHFETSFVYFFFFYFFFYIKPKVRTLIISNLPVYFRKITHIIELENDLTFYFEYQNRKVVLKIDLAIVGLVLTLEILNGAYFIILMDYYTCFSLLSQSTQNCKLIL